MLGNLIHLTYCISVSNQSPLPFPFLPHQLQSLVIRALCNRLQAAAAAAAVCHQFEQGALLRIFVVGGGVSLATMHTHTHSTNKPKDQPREQELCNTIATTKKKWLYLEHTHAVGIAVELQWDSEKRKGRKTNWWSKPNFSLLLILLILLPGFASPPPSPLYLINLLCTWASTTRE